MATFRINVSKMTLLAIGYLESTGLLQANDPDFEKGLNFSDSGLTVVME